MTIEMIQEICYTIIAILFLIVTAILCIIMIKYEIKYKKEKQKEMKEYIEKCTDEEKAVIGKFIAHTNYK